MSFRRNPFQGIISINGKRYLARDVIEALLQQGVVVNVDESGLIIGYKRVPPLSDENLQRLIERGDINPGELVPIMGACNCQEKVEQLQQMMHQLITLMNQLLTTFSYGNMSTSPSRSPPPSPSPSRGQSAGFKDQLAHVVPSSQAAMSRSPVNPRSFSSSSSTHLTRPLPTSSMSNAKKNSDNPWSLMDQLFPNTSMTPTSHHKVPPPEPSQQKMLEHGMSILPPFQALRCHSCKSPLPSGSLFCSKCGAKVRT